MSKETDQHIADERSYEQTMRALNAQEKPSKMLCLLMNMLESYRQSRKMGWSRAWNKYGLTTFQSFKLDAAEDGGLSVQALLCLKVMRDVPAEASDFVQDLLAAPESLMGFLFFSEYEEDGQRYETVTLSFGRKVPSQPRFRDRFDVLFDAPVLDGEPQPLARVRVYVDPYQQGEKEPLWSAVWGQETISAEMFDLFAQLCVLSWQWQPDAEKHWDHWTSRYIDYFGPRSAFPAQSHFFLEHGQAIAPADVRLPAE